MLNLELNEDILAASPSNNEFIIDHQNYERDRMWDNMYQKVIHKNKGYLEKKIQDGADVSK